MSNVVTLDEIREQGGQGQIIGPEYIKVAPGVYPAQFLHFETNRRYSKKAVNRGQSKREFHTGGKIYLWFELDPELDTDIAMLPNKKIFLPYNAIEIAKPFGTNGKFKVGRRSRCYKDYERLIGRASERIDLNAYRGRIWQVRVKTVTHNDRQRKHKEEDQYSEIEEIIGLL